MDATASCPLMRFRAKTLTCSPSPQASTLSTLPSLTVTPESGCSSCVSTHDALPMLDLSSLPQRAFESQTMDSLPCFLPKELAMSGSHTSSESSTNATPRTSHSDRLAAALAGVKAAIAAFGEVVNSQEVDVSAAELAHVQEAKAMLEKLRDAVGMEEPPQLPVPPHIEVCREFVEHLDSDLDLGSVLVITQVNTLGVDCLGTMRRHYSKFGPVRMVLMPRGLAKTEAAAADIASLNGFALVVFREASDARAALKVGAKQNVKGSLLEVEALNGATMR